MNLLHRTFSLSLALLCAFLPVLPAHAAKNKKEQVAAEAAPEKTCQGVNMLEELRSTDPETFAKIEADAKATENTGAILWKIEKANLAPSYLFGTIHLTDTRVATIPEPAAAALSGAKTLLVEIADLSPQSSSAGLSEALKFAIYTDGKSLETELAPPEYRKVQETLSKSGIPADAAKLLKPWIVTMLLSASDCERRKMQEGAPVLDMRIVETARMNGASVIGLETIESQLQALASIPEDKQIKMLKSALVYADRTYDLVETTLQLYLKRDMGAVWPFQLALARKAGFEEGTFAGVQSALIAERNVKMRDGALPHLEKGAAFIAVGALHLPGKSGLVTLFREKGYTLTPMQ
jgi:hypothetical protein